MVFGKGTQFNASELGYRGYKALLNKSKKELEIIRKKQIETRLGKGNIRIQRMLKCKCGNIYELFVTDNKFQKNNYRKHCSRKCANGRERSILTKKLISNSRLGIKNEICDYKEGRINKIIRDRLFDKYNGLCQLCSKKLERSKNKYKIHHIDVNLSKESKVKYLKTDNRILFCPKCHGLIHKQFRELKRDIDNLYRLSSIGRACDC